MVEITLRQAKALVEFFGGEDARVTVIESNSGKSLLAFCTEHPEEGSVNLGFTRVLQQRVKRPRPIRLESKPSSRSVRIK